METNNHIKEEVKDWLYEMAFSLFDNDWAMSLSKRERLQAINIVKELETIKQIRKNDETEN